MQSLSSADLIWFAVGFSGQGLLSLRILIQSLTLDRGWRHPIPLAFWYFSIAGGLALLVYAIHRADPVFIVGQTAALLFYIRNLYVITQQRRHSATGARDTFC
jgi:lipid-A-disaccharide synthase-like uncharacterized protein